MELAMILCAGHAAFDIGFSLDEFPREDQKYLVESTAESSGGPAANAASLLGRWGHPVALLAPLGVDFYGAAVRRDLEADGVATDLLQSDPDYPTPLSMIIRNRANGSRTILTRRTARPPLRIDPSALARFAPIVEGLLFDGHEPEASFALMELYPGAWSVLDAGTLRPGTEALARRVDYLIASERFTDALARRDGRTASESGIDALRSLSSRWVGFTRGERGCLWYDPVHRLRGALPALPVQTVDTTGAGDLFHGAFVYGLSLTGDPVAALQWGTVAAGFSVQRPGGRASIPSLAEVERELARRPCLPTFSVVV